MVAELRTLGVQQLFVSVHPFSEQGSLSYTELMDRNLCTKDANNATIPWGGFNLPTCTNPQPPFKRSDPTQLSLVNEGNSSENTHCLYDPSNSAARAYLWDKVKASYYDRNITNFWTDGTEPAGSPTNEQLPTNTSFTNIASTTGERLPGSAAWMMWPVWHAQTVYEGAVAAGAVGGSAGSWSLVRSAWAGSQGDRFWGKGFFFSRVLCGSHGCWMEAIRCAVHSDVPCLTFVAPNTIRPNAKVTDTTRLCGRVTSQVNGPHSNNK
jgi:hypothetical protein